MTIGAVSLTNYSASLQYQYFGTAISADKIKDLMNAYGIMTTGDANIDLQNLHDAMQLNATDNLKETQASQQQTPPAAKNVPWADLMNQIGLPLTGSIDADYNAFNQKIFEMQMSATTPTEKANIAQLQAQALIAFVPPQNSNPNQSTPQVSGTDIIAQLNKMYLLGF